MCMLGRNAMVSDIRLKRVTKSDIVFLYELLSERDPRANISHRKMPSFNQHAKFVMSKPYMRWYIIEQNNTKLGSVYLTKQDEVGIFIKKKSQGKKVGSKALKIMMKLNPRTRYLANVNPANCKSILFFKKNGFTLIQHTYELTRKR